MCYTPNAAYMCLSSNPLFTQLVDMGFESESAQSYKAGCQAHQRYQEICLVLARHVLEKSEVSKKCDGVFRTEYVHGAVRGR
jgi:hypothetical protein